MPRDLPDQPGRPQSDSLSSWSAGPQLLEPTEDEEARLSRMATLGALACMLAHEMNNLLTPVLNYAKLALDAPANDQLNQRAHENAIASVNACNAMAGSLLGFAASKDTPNAEIAACIRRAVECLPRSLSKDGIVLAIEAPRDLHVAISNTELVQVLLNFVLNARRAMPQGGQLTIQAERSTWNTDRDAVVITVRDTGSGMDEETAARIFTPFFTSGEQGGSGLGLTICKRLIEDAGGEIELETAPGAGTTFTVTLPAAEPDAGHASPAA